MRKGTTRVKSLSATECVGKAYPPANFNPTALQIVQPSSNTSCFPGAAPVKKDFDFQVYGDVAQCQQTFGIAWTTSPGLAPYTCTIVPLDASYNPWQVLLTDNSDGGSSNASQLWQVNMTSGTRFTIMMKWVPDPPASYDYAS